MTEASEARITTYAEALLAIAGAENRLADVEDELFRFARTLDGSDELREAVGDPQIPVARRQQIVEDLLGEDASDVTVAIVSLVIRAGRAKDLPAIADHLVAMSASRRKRAVAEVRTVVELSEDQRTRLASAIEQATGLQVEVKVIIDPSIFGGVVTQIGEIVIDGSVRHRLAELRESF